MLAQHGGFPFDIVVDRRRVDAGHGEALRRFGDRIRVVRQDNAGLNPARNHGLRLARGAYIALLDDDDVWLPGKTVRLMAALERYPQAGFVHSNFFIWKPELDERRADGLRSWFPRPFAWAEMYEERERRRPGRRCRRGRGCRPRGPAYFGDIYYWSLFAPMVLPSTAIIRRSAPGRGHAFPGAGLGRRLGVLRAALASVRRRIRAARDHAESQPRRCGAADAHAIRGCACSGASA